VNILAAAVDAARDRQRRRMFTDQSDLHERPSVCDPLWRVARRAVAWISLPDSAFGVPLVVSVGRGTKRFSVRRALNQMSFGSKRDARAFTWRV
ncbi:hypothetical protein, partial [Caballeronia arvi]|uniref:hypothetical protein n=1 Tax=Caballeronia arvi TaxID=1777135 RepID=UPI001F38CB09